MNNAEFMSLMGDLEKYLNEEKVFIKNPARFAEVASAREIANELFGTMEIIVEDDPLQMGALIITIKGMDVVVRGTREIELFQELVSKADNFEICPDGDEGIIFSLLFNHALIRVPQGK